MTAPTPAVVALVFCNVASIVGLVMATRALWRAERQRRRGDDLANLFAASDIMDRGMPWLGAAWVFNIIAHVLQGVAR